MMPENFYDILGCLESASYEEIKRNYQQLIKQHHPDKQTPSEQLADSQFVDIDRAWKTLRDENLRKQYDALLLQDKFSDQPSLVFAKLNVHELEFNENSISCYPCRCGNTYTIDKALFNETDRDYTIECDECSYVIIVNNKR